MLLAAHALGADLILCVFLQLDVMARRHWDPSFTPSVPIPELRTSATGMALTMGVFANARYQMLGGIDRYLFDHSNFLLPYLGMSTAFRAVSTWFGQETRLHLQVRFVSSKVEGAWQKQIA